jgi:DNA-binding protein Fis
MTTPAKHNSEKSDNLSLTVKPSLASLKHVPSEHTRRNYKQTCGGNVKNIEPPMSGFSISATLSDSNELSGVARNRTPLRGNTCSVSVRTLIGSRQLLNCQHYKQTYENNAMQNTQTPAIGAPALMAKGFHPESTGTACLIPFQTYLDALQQAQADKATKGKGQAYHQLLNAFHQAILPLLFAETKGNLSEVSRLLGIHRETISIWCKQLGLNSRANEEVQA